MPKSSRGMKLFMGDILEAIRKIKLYTEGMNYDEFLKDDKTKDAVLRNLEIIGEAVKNLPAEVKKKHPKINWRVIVGMRDKLIHEYFGVSYQIVWETIKSDLPAFERQISKISKNLS